MESNIDSEQKLIPGVCLFEGLGLYPDFCLLYSQDPHASKSYVMTGELKLNIAPGMVLSSVDYPTKIPIIFREASFVLLGHILKYLWS